MLRGNSEEVGDRQPRQSDAPGSPPKGDQGGDRKQLWGILAHRARPVLSEVPPEVAKGTWECGL